MIENDPLWLEYRGGSTGAGPFAEGNIQNQFAAFGSRAGYDNVDALCGASNRLLLQISRSMQNIRERNQSELTGECSRLVLVLLDVIVNDMVHDSGATTETITSKLNTHGVRISEVASNCHNDVGLVTAIRNWINAYDDLKKVPKISISRRQFVRSSRKVVRQINQSSMNMLTGTVILIVTTIAIIPVISALRALTTHGLQMDTGVVSLNKPFEDQGWLAAVTASTTSEVLEQLTTNAVLSYSNALEDAANSGTYSFGIQRGSSTDNQIVAQYKQAILHAQVGAGLESPLNQGTLVLARGALESGIHMIKMNEQDYYIMSLLTYARNIKENVSILYREQLMIDVSAKIAKTIHGYNNLPLRCDVYNGMLDDLGKFVDARQTHFDTLSKPLLEHIDAVTETFDVFNVAEAPITRVMEGIDRCNHEQFQNGLARLYDYYTSYVEWNIHTIAHTLVSIPVGNKDSDIANRVRDVYNGQPSDHYRTISRLVWEQLNIMHMSLLFGNDSVGTRLLQWKQRFNAYPLETVLASLAGAGATVGGAVAVPALIPFASSNMVLGAIISAASGAMSAVGATGLATWWYG